MTVLSLKYYFWNKSRKFFVYDKAAISSGLFECCLVFLTVFWYYHNDFLFHFSKMFLFKFFLFYTLIWGSFCFWPDFSASFPNSKVFAKHYKVSGIVSVMCYHNRKWRKAHCSTNPSTLIIMQHSSLVGLKVINSHLWQFRWNHGGREISEFCKVIRPVSVWPGNMSKQEQDLHSSCCLRMCGRKTGHLTSS